MRALISTLCCVALSSSAVAADSPGGDNSPPTRFVRGGESLQIASPAGLGDSAAVLRAFGRTWGEPIAPTNQTFVVTPAAPRVAVTFELVPADQPESPIARIVAYPATPVSWSEKRPLLVDRHAPDWIREWLRAVRLPVEEVDLSTARRALRPNTQGAGVVLVGGQTAGANLEQFVELQSRWEMNAIVLDADWLQASPLPPVERSVPSGFERFQAGHGLESLRRWAPLSRLRRPAFVSQWPGLANRRSWFSMNGETWVEEIATSGHSALLTSAVDWPQLLGSEPADVLFHELLRSGAEPRRDDFPGSRHTIAIWPLERENVSPVLRGASALSTGTKERRVSSVHVLDVRGPDLSLASGKNLPVKRILEGAEPWIILGDDAAFSEANRAAFREQSSKPAAAARLFWIEDDRPPADLAAEIPLMQTLTEFGVRLPFESPQSP